MQVLYLLGRELIKWKNLKKKEVLAISEKFSGTGRKLFFSLVIICSGSQRFYVLGPRDIGAR